MQNIKPFRAFVIAPSKIKIIKKLIAVSLLLVLFSLIIKSFPSVSQKLAFSDTFYKTVISEELHTSENNISVRQVISMALGFDIKNPKSIIGKYSSAMAEELVPEKTPAPTESPVPSPPPQKLEEKNVHGGMKISNTTSISVNPDVLADTPLSFFIEKNAAPQILIMHTHTTESFSDSNKDKYLEANSDRCLEASKNITAVGTRMNEIFNKNGINTIHDTTVHDYPSYNGAYTRAMSTIGTALSENPTIKIVLDVHRDGITKEDGTKVGVTSDIRNQKTAQCMFVVGSNALLTHDNWQENMKLACKIQRLANEMYPGLMRPMILREERFNQQASTGSLILEVGSNGNTLEEAIRGGERMAEVISALFS